jgi:hypothetical protein
VWLPQGSCVCGAGSVGSRCGCGDPRQRLGCQRHRQRELQRTTTAVAEWTTRVSSGRGGLRATPAVVGMARRLLAIVGKEQPLERRAIQQPATEVMMMVVGVVVVVAKLVV